LFILKKIIEISILVPEKNGVFESARRYVIKSDPDSHKKVLHSILFGAVRGTFGTYTTYRYLLFTSKVPYLHHLQNRLSSDYWP
jgi:hypothetical protein